MEPDKKLEIESRSRGEKLQALQSSPEWSAVVEIYERLSKQWRANLLSMTDEDSIEKIAKERLKWLYRLSGLEIFFTQMADDIEMSKTEEDKEDDLDDEQKSNKE